MDRRLYVDQTFIHPLGLLMIIALGAATFALPRRYALVPMLIIAYLVSPAQRITVLSLDFNSIRLMILIGWIRVMAMGETKGFRWSMLDSLFLAWTVSATLFYMAHLGIAGFVARSGSYIFEQFGAYLLARQLLRNWDDMIALVRAAAFIALPSVMFFFIEWSTGRNMFHIFGGVHEFTVVRQGRLRCQGAFPHAIIAGTAWAIWMPLFACMWRWERRSRGLYLLAWGAAAFIIIASASSTPVFAAATGVFVVALYPARRYLQLLRWGAVAALFILHFSMEAPVWHLVSRVSAVGGSTSYHRFKLIDNFITRFDEWFLVGARTTAHWGHGQQDVTNHYVVQGVTGGLVPFLLFIALIAYTFVAVGRTQKAVRSDARKNLLAWGLGGAIFVHAVSFIGISYFGQVQLLWALHVGVVGAMYQFVVVEKEGSRKWAYLAAQYWRRYGQMPRPATSNEPNAGGART